MIIDQTFDGLPLRDVGAAAARAEELGARGAWIGELNSDPFLPLAMAAEHTTRLEVGTSVAIAFARSPMTMAATAHDLQAFSRGRLVLGLGTQVRAHVTRRFSMPWSSPAARMREYILALHAIWSAWRTGAPLEFRGEFYTHTLMPPLFRPSPQPYGPPKVMVAGVGPRLVQVAGEVGDGLFVHPFSSPEYVERSILPALAKGVASSGRSRADLSVAGALLTATGPTDAAIAESAERARRQVAFYASTAAYEPVLATHGWQSLQPRLAQLIKEGRWDDLGEVVPDEVLRTFALVGAPAEVAAQLRSRWSGILDRASLVAPAGIDDTSWRQIRDACT